MSSAPYFTNIRPYVISTLNNRTKNIKETSTLSAYFTAVSYTIGSSGGGLIISSNPNVNVYGSSGRNGRVGSNVGGGDVFPDSGTDDNQGFRPIPIITSAEIEEQHSDDGASNFSRTARFVIRCFSLGQMEKVTEYFLSPGSSIYLKWGWNTSNGSQVYGTDPTKVAKLKNFSEVLAWRSSTNGESDLYLGFVTGGDVSMQGEYWDVTVNARGHMELPAYLMVADNTKPISKVNTSSAPPPPPLEYGGNEISAEVNLGRKRWMMCFNLLPSNKRTAIIKGLEPILSDEANFINFDDGVKDALNSVTKLGFWDSLFGGGVSITFGAGVKAEIAEDTKLIGDEKFIRFGALMQIINTGEIDSLSLKGTKIQNNIRSDRTYCCGFKHIFSTDASKLFIPNKNTPKADFVTIAANGGVQTDFSGTTDNTVNGVISYTFPEQNAGSTKIQTPNDAKEIQFKQFRAGKLNNLYVNFDFAKKILETKSLSTKDAVYQILNGMSSAAGSIWDFQIVENTVNGVTELEIIDFNLTGKAKSGITTFNVSGATSPFLEVGMKMDISGQFANQIVYEKSAAAANSSMPPIKGLFVTTGDMLIEPANPSPIVPGVQSAPASKPANADEENARKKRDFATFLQKVGLAPGVKATNTVTWPTDGNILNICYQTAFNDLSLFEHFKQIEGDLQKKASGDASILLPFEVTLTMHGVSGWRRGDMFMLDSIPGPFKNGGFFQVTGIKQILNDDYWQTEVTGTFRTVHTK